MTSPWALVARKELGDLLGRLGRRPLMRTLGVVAVFGLLVPSRSDLFANLPAFFALFMAFLPARLVAIDAFAGERERGTLENLLALPLADRDIWLGKLVAATLYGAARGWVFVAVWLPSAVLLRATGIAADLTLPDAVVVLGAVVGAPVVAYVAAVFGLWQSAAAPSVRAIVETGGILRLVIMVSVFFVAPWIGGLLGPRIGFRGGSPVSVAESLAGAGPAAAGVVAIVGIGVLWRLTVASARRAQREALALVDGGVAAETGAVRLRGALGQNNTSTKLPRRSRVRLKQSGQR